MINVLKVCCRWGRSCALYREFLVSQYSLKQVDVSMHFVSHVAFITSCASLVVFITSVNYSVQQQISKR